MINQLAKAKYLYCCNSDILHKVIVKINESKIIDVEGEHIFNETVTNLLSSLFLFKEYWPILKDLLIKLARVRIDQRMEKHIHQIMKKIKIAVLEYKIPPIYITNEFKQYYKLDILKAEYLINIFNRA